MQRQNDYRRGCWGGRYGYYTSRLNVTLNSDLISKTIECTYTDGRRNSTIMDTIMNLRTYYYEHVYSTYARTL